MSVTATLTHLAVLPYADLTLLSVNAITGIVWALILSIFFLNERLIVKYDIPALILIVGGCLTIVLLSNKEMVDFDADTITAMLFSVKTLAYLSFCCVIIVIDYVVLNYVLKLLRDFELDATKYDQK